MVNVIMIYGAGVTISYVILILMLIKTKSIQNNPDFNEPTFTLTARVLIINQYLSYPYIPII